MPPVGSAGASSPPDTGGGSQGGAGGGILGFFSNFFTYGKEQDIIRTQGDYMKFFQKGSYTSDNKTDLYIIVALVFLLISILFFFRKK